MLASSQAIEYPKAMSEIVFEVAGDEDGGFVAECLTEGIFTQTDGWDQLRENVKEAVAAFSLIGRKSRWPSVSISFAMKCSPADELPRDLSGDELVRVLCRNWGYRISSTNREATS